MGIYQRKDLHRIRKAQIRSADTCWSMSQNTVKLLQLVFTGSS